MRKRHKYLGECYRDSIEFMLENELGIKSSQLTLVHGTVVFNSSPDDHAWVELRDELVFTPDKDGKMQTTIKDKFYRDFQVSEKGLKKYTFDEANLALLKHHHYGPWE